MMITDQEATELKTWVVKRLEDMYINPPAKQTKTARVPVQEHMDNISHFSHKANIDYLETVPMPIPTSSPIMS